jgi:hypothetical protein
MHADWDHKLIVLIAERGAQKKEPQYGCPSREFITTLTLKAGTALAHRPRVAGLTTHLACAFVARHRACRRLRVSRAADTWFLTRAPRVLALLEVGAITAVPGDVDVHHAVGAVDVRDRPVCISRKQRVRGGILIRAVEGESHHARQVGVR